MDIESLPSNSHKSRAKQYDLPEKKVESVVSGKCNVKKRGGLIKLADVFLPEDVVSVKSYILNDVVIPKIKDLLHDIGAEAWDSFWGISGRSGARPTASRLTYTSYDRYSRLGANRAEEHNPRRTSGINYDDIVFSSRGDAELVLERMDELCDKYKQVSIADLYDLADISNDNYTLNKYGWTDIREAKIVRLSGGGYTIKMPRATSLD